MTSHDEGRRRRDDALDRVEKHAAQDWKVAARWAVVVLAECRELLTTDAVWALLDHWGVRYDTHEPRALGAIMQNAARDGLIEATDRTHKSVRPECHCRPIRIWRSLRCN